MPATCVPCIQLPARLISSIVLLYSSGLNVDRNFLSSVASGLSMFACKSEKPFKRDFNCGTLLRRSAGIACNSPVAGFAYLSNAINAGLPSALLTTFAENSDVSTPLSQIDVDGQIGRAHV